MRNDQALAVLRYPRFRFRPGQADALHLDLWHHGVNLLRDAGTYSYNADGAEWFSGTAGYPDARGARHHREVILTADALICRDTISGDFDEACLRWRLAPRAWRLDGTTLRNGDYAITIDIDGAPLPPTLTTTWDSRYYQQKTEIPQASVIVNRPATLITKVTF